ncbi:aldehyde dehydrogenase [Spongiivirga citrea]|uniref:Aldehyde dehydrogenase n=1 Tax=Spongiivirga citrea TaxID=1481457 RepID=A0A6M0CR13_9FLAO|nr:aldehyde dehydrogenase [Spongiivirga citrea]NER16380.1 aldehyde dehydrogenase family protein [Spongiivirga citrea]
MKNSIDKIINTQRDFFLTHETKPIAYRIAALKRLKSEINKREQDIHKAVNLDFKKSEFESVLSETGIVQKELNLLIKNLARWSRPERVKSSMLNFPSADYIYKDPYGTILIIAPWNYPFQLAIVPLIGAIAAGNTAVVKPSELTPNTSKVINEICKTVFDEAYVSVVQGGVEVSQELLSKRWDYIFFTGSVFVGKIVAKAAAEFLTPVTLELGGKNPCIIDHTAKLKLAAKRLVWAKFLNGGQTCVAPDYILIDNKVKTEFIKHYQNEIKKAYGENPQESPDYPRIINEKNFNRLEAMLKDERIPFGGRTDKNDLYIEPTIIDQPDLDSEVMKDEIFGPILPVLGYDNETEINAIIKTYDKPLSFYVFSTRKAYIKKLLSSYSFGGGVINDAIVYYANPNLPFGGVGNSGIGGYHGKQTFETFTHNKAVSKRANWLDAPIRYAPYKGKLGQLKTFLKYF